MDCSSAACLRRSRVRQRQSGDFTPSGCGRASKAHLLTRSRWTDLKAGARNGRTCVSRRRVSLPVRPRDVALAGTCRVPEDGGFATGPWSGFTPFTRTIGEPADVRTSLSAITCSYRQAGSSAPRTSACRSRPARTSHHHRGHHDRQHELRAAYASNYVNGGTLFWRIAAIDGPQRWRVRPGTEDQHRSAPSDGLHRAAAPAALSA